MVKRRGDVAATMVLEARSADFEIGGFDVGRLLW